MYLKGVCIIMISTHGYMHNKRFIILNCLENVLLHDDFFYLYNIVIQIKVEVFLRIIKSKVWIDLFRLWVY